MSSEVSVPAFIVEDSPLFKTLDQIAKIDWDEGSVPYLSITAIKNEDGTRSFSVSTDQIPIQNHFLDRILHVIQRFFNIIPRHDIDHMKDLPLLYMEVLNLPEETRAQYGDVVKRSFDALQDIYEAYRPKQTTWAAAYKNDLLEAVATGMELDMGINRIKADPIEPFNKRIKGHHIPVFRMEDLDEVVRLMREKFTRPPTDEELENDPDLHPQYQPPTLEQIRNDPDLRNYLIIEKVAMGRVVNWMYKHRRIGKILNNNFFSGAVTWWMERTAKKEMEEGKDRTENVLRFYKRMGISVATARNGELYSYTEMFQKKLRDETSCDGAFQRSLNDSGRAMLLEKAKNVAQNGEIPVISNSFCRIRILNVGENGAAQRFSIEGKRLNNGERHGFSIKNLFGNEDNVNLSINHAIDPKMLNAITAQEKSNVAEYLYRCCLTNAVDRENATMVVQRLAPEDIHHYCEPVGGRVLSLAEACAKLQELLDDERSVEKEQLQKLMDYFAEKDPENKAGVAMIQGARMSVSTLGTTHTSPLGQNDRKIMMVQNPDGSIAIHTFIGAISVNNVQVDIHPGAAELGAEVGAMGIGNHDRTLSPKMATLENSILIKHPVGPVEIGDEEGVFDKSGSTVVSIYFNFRPAEKLKRASNILVYKDLRGRERNIELQVQMGDLIGSLT